MSDVTTIGLYIAKNVFLAHAADGTAQTVFGRKLSRGKLLSFFVSQPRWTVSLEECGGAHRRAADLLAMGMSFG